MLQTGHISFHSLGLDASDQAHSGSLTRDVPPRLCYPLRRAPRRSEAFRCWCAAPLSTLYPPSTSESSSGDSSKRPLHSSSHSAGPSRKRCRSPIDYIHIRLRDTEIDPIETEVDMKLGISDGDDVRDHVEIDPRDVRDETEEYEADISAGDTVEVGIDPLSALIVEDEIVEPDGKDSFDSFGTRDGIFRSFEDMSIDLDDVVRDFYHHMFEVCVDRIVGIETAQRRLENLKEEFRQVHRDHDDTRWRLRSFKGTKGVVGLIRWSENIETVFHINNCLERYQVKYVTCTLLDSALTWRNSHKRTIGTNATYAISWRELLKLMTEVYCPRNKIQKMETKLWNLSVKNNDMATYTQRFQELTMMCTKMVPEEEDRVEKFIGGLPDNIQGNVIVAEPTRLQDAVQIANNLMDQKLKGYAARNAKNKRRLNNKYRNIRGQQPPHKRQNTSGQNVARAYMAGNNE
ncbi:reverse transcriptase domain-containing protein [Tanacetum coccineum]